MGGSGGGEKEGTDSSKKSHEAKLSCIEKGKGQSTWLSRGGELRKLERDRKKKKRLSHLFLTGDPFLSREGESLL